MFNPGDLVYIRTTDEPVVVLRRDSLASWLNTESFVVRRPVQGRNGIRHIRCVFHAFELESPTEHAQRHIDEQKLMQRLMFPEHPEPAETKMFSGN